MTGNTGGVLAGDHREPRRTRSTEPQTPVNFDFACRVDRLRRSLVSRRNRYSESENWCLPTRTRSVLCRFAVWAYRLKCRGS